MGLIIKTNKQWRPILHSYELPDSAREQFEHLNDEEFYGTSFVKYKGYFYELGEFMRVADGGDFAAAGWDGSCNAAGWDGICINSLWEGVLIKLSNDGERYQIASFRVEG
jgi:hypothetical protein